MLELIVVVDNFSLTVYTIEKSGYLCVHKMFNVSFFQIPYSIVDIHATQDCFIIICTTGQIYCYTNGHCKEITRVVKDSNSYFYNIAYSSVFVADGILIISTVSQTGQVDLSVCLDFTSQSICSR